MKRLSSSDIIVLKWFETLSLPEIETLTLKHFKDLPLKHLNGHLVTEMYNKEFNSKRL